MHTDLVLVRFVDPRLLLNPRLDFTGTKTREGQIKERGKRGENKSKSGKAKLSVTAETSGTSLSWPGGGGGGGLSVLVCARNL